MLQCGSFSWLCEVPPMLTLAKKPFLTSVGNPCRKQPTETIIQVLTSLLLLPNIKSTQPLFLHEKEKWSGMRGTDLQTFSAFWNESEVRRRVGPRFKSLLTAWFPVVQQRWREMSPPPQSIIYIFFVAQSPQKASNTEASTPMRKFPSVLQVPNVYLLQYWSRLQTGRSFPLSSGPLRGINQEWKSETAPSHVPTPTAVLEYPHFLQVLVPQTFLNYLLLKGISLLLCKEFLLNLLPFQVFGKAEGSAICQELLGLDTEGNRPWC